MSENPTYSEKHKDPRWQKKLLEIGRQGRRMRRSVDLEAKRSSDAKAMLLESENPTVDRTKHVIQAIREYCTNKGYARKKDSV